MLRKVELSHNYGLSHHYVDGDYVFEYESGDSGVRSSSNHPDEIVNKLNVYLRLIDEDILICTIVGKVITTKNTKVALCDSVTVKDISSKIATTSFLEDKKIFTLYFFDNCDERYKLIKFHDKENTFGVSREFNTDGVLIHEFPFEEVSLEEFNSQERYHTSLYDIKSLCDKIWACNGEQREWWPNGNIKYIIPWEKGICNGTKRVWNEYGQMVEQTRWTNGVRNGLDKL